MATPAATGRQREADGGGQVRVEARQLDFVEADVADRERRARVGRLDRQADEGREPVDEPGSSEPPPVVTTRSRRAAPGWLR